VTAPVTPGPHLPGDGVDPAPWQEGVRRMAHGIRRRVLEHTVRQGGGYLSQACSAAEILAALYGRLLRLGEAVPLAPGPFAGVPGPGRRAATGAVHHGPPGPHLDRLIVSPAHYALVLYACLIEAGRMAEDGLAQFNRDGSTVEMIGAEHSPGMEVTTGSLGQGLSQALGIALARHRRGETGRTFVFMSDGEFQEGQTWEALAVAAHHRVGSLCVVVDVNGQQCDGRMAEVLDVGDLGAKVRSFGSAAVEVDGHDVDALASATTFAHADRPLVVLCRTSPVRGIDLLAERAPKLHYVRFADPGERARYADLLSRFGEGT
jgi:transketolase